MATERQWLSDLKERAAGLKADTYALFLASRRPDVPWRAKAVAVAVVAYAFSPIDLIPDFIPVLGYLDDLLLLPLGIALAIRLIPRPILEECREQARRQIADRKNPANWVAGALVLLVWAAVLFFLVRWILHLATGAR